MGYHQESSARPSYLDIAMGLLQLLPRRKHSPVAGWRFSIKRGFATGFWGEAYGTLEGNNQFVHD